jgi:hypothetical protein
MPALEASGGTSLKEAAAGCRANRIQRRGKCKRDAKAYPPPPGLFFITKLETRNQKLEIGKENENGDLKVAATVETKKESGGEPN